MHAEADDNDDGECKKNPIPKFGDIPSVLEGRDHDILEKLQSENGYF